MTVQKIYMAFLAASLTLSPAVIYASGGNPGNPVNDTIDVENDCTAGQPLPVVSKEVQKKLKSYSMKWEHSSGHKMGIIEKIQLNSGTDVSVSSGGCTSYGVDYVIYRDALM